MASSGSVRRAKDGVSEEERVGGMEGRMVERVWMAVWASEKESDHDTFCSVDIGRRMVFAGGRLLVVTERVVIILKESFEEKKVDPFHFYPLKI